MMTRKDESNEFRMLTKGILQDGRVDTDEANVVKRWMEEHQRADEFANPIGRLEGFLTDKYIDRFESKNLCEMIGTVLTRLRQEATSEQIA